MVALNGVLDVELTVPDPEELASFWLRRGLARGGEGVLGTETRPVQLRLADGPYRHLSDLHLGCDEEADLVGVRDRLVAMGVETRLGDGVLRCVDPIFGHAVTIEVGKPEPVRSENTRPGNRPGETGRWDAAPDAVMEERPRVPRRLAHVVLSTPDVPASERFYVDGIGFKVTERAPGGAGVFTRCSPEHHNLLLLRTRAVPHINHYALEMDDVDAIGKAAQATLDERPESHVVGLGRHVAGGNLFWYLLDPAGTMFEFFSDMDQIRDEDRWAAELARRPAPSASPVKTWGPEPPRIFWVPADLAEIAAGREAEGL
ncbi:VOC family protein [Parafrankia elaeagni]|uniref:VOC family protein n=1 Tax=Parafrankia elaeagni TaxID=222534 RepID=UPI0003AA5E01|nr:VOC family protein [Parafrankia elaeagni]